MRRVRLEEVMIGIGIERPLSFRERGTASVRRLAGSNGRELPIRDRSDDLCKSGFFEGNFEVQSID